MCKKGELISQEKKASVGLRNLTRALSFMRQALALAYPVTKSVHDAFMTCFGSHLDGTS